MKAAVLTGLRRIEVRDIPLPGRRSENDVLLRTAAAGICGSDLHYFRHGRIGDQAVSYPFIVGHECSAVVEETGSGVRKLRPGDRVAVDPAVSCGECDQCRSGRAHTCRRLLFLGCPGQLSGCLAEYLVLPARNCHPLPRGLTMVEGALIEPFTIGLYALKLWLSLRDPHSPPVGEARVGILGAGPIGLGLLLAAKAKGLSSIFATDPVSFRRNAARASGAVWVGRPDTENLIPDLLARNPQGLDAVFECCGDQAALDQAADLLKPGGALVIIGIPETGRISFDIDRMRRREIRILNVRRQNDTTGEAVSLAASRSTDISFLGTPALPLREVSSAFQQASDYRNGVLRAIIDFSLP